MLTPDELLYISEGAEQVAEQLHIEILKQVIQRIMIRIGRGEDLYLTPRDKWQLDVLQDSGILREDIIKEIAKLTKTQAKVIKESFDNACVKTWNYDSKIYSNAGISVQPLKQSPYFVRLIQRGYESTFGLWDNYTRTTADAAQRLFIASCDKAYNMVASGAQSYTSAVKDAVKTIAKSGVIVNYPSGHTDTIETATLRCVRTGVSQMCAEITGKRMDENNWDTILVSAHLGARVTDKDDYTNHAWWQGKFYSKSGEDKRFPPFGLCGYGDVQGINGANCRHSWGVGDGVNNPYQHFDSDENKEAYEKQQRQRLLERRIRAAKRECYSYNAARNNATGQLADELNAEYERKSYILQKRNSEYNDFCESNNLKKLSDRTSIAGWDRSEAAQASAAARKYIKTH